MKYILRIIVTMVSHFFLFSVCEYLVEKFDIQFQLPFNINTIHDLALSPLVSKTHLLGNKFTKETILFHWINEKYFSVLLIYQLFDYNSAKIQLASF